MNSHINGIIKDFKAIEKEINNPLNTICYRVDEGKRLIAYLDNGFECSAITNTLELVSLGGEYIKKSPLDLILYYNNPFLDFVIFEDHRDAIAWLMAE